MSSIAFTNMRAALKRNIDGLTQLDEAQQAALLEREFLYCLIECDHPELLHDEQWLKHRLLPSGGAWDEVIARCKRMASSYREEGAPEVGDDAVPRFDAPEQQPETEEEAHLRALRSWALREGLEDNV
jgi:hypothetical protein